MMRLANKVAMVTGAAQGIGAEIARRFHEEGALVFLCDIDAAKGEETTRGFKTAAAAQKGGAAPASGSGPHTLRAFFLSLDVTSEESWKAAFAAALARAGRIDVLVNNAGINIRKSIEEMPVEDLDAVFAVNVRGPFLGIKHAIPIMRAGGGGVILNTSSVCGVIGHRYTNEAYIASKGALSLLTKAVAVHYAKDKIRCNAVLPSTVDTPLAQALLADPARRAERLGEVPLGRLAKPRDVADAFVYLASDEAAFVTGVNFPVDGGVTAY